MFTQDNINENLNRQVSILLDDLLSSKNTSNPRGINVYEKFQHTFVIESYYPFISFKEREFNWKYWAGEMYWYLSKDKSPNKILHFSKFWSKITDINGEVNSNYGRILLGDQFNWITSILDKDINSRQAVAFINSPEYQVENNRDFPCTMYLNFWVRENKLNMKVQMRSNDIWKGAQFDIPFFAFYHQLIYLYLRNINEDILLGTYYHSSDNTHIYEEHFEMSKKVINSKEIFDMYHLEVKYDSFFDNSKFSLETDAIKSFNMRIERLIDRNSNNQLDYLKILEDLFYIEKLS